MKNILLLVHDDGGQEARVQAALDVTRAVKGHLRCLDVTQWPTLVGDPYGVIDNGVLLEVEREREADNAIALKQRLAAEDVSWDWDEVTGSISESIINAAGLADLIVLNRRLDLGLMPDMRSITGDVAVRGRRPVLAVPEGLRELDCTGPVLVAWDGSASSEAAMSAAVPLLALASTVCLLTVGDKVNGSPVEDAAAYLSRHGIHAEIRRVPMDGRPVDESIREQCRAIRASYCVMGAYGHSRLAEALLGGVTRSLLTHSEIPLLMTH